MMKQACRQTLKSLAAECLVGVRLGLLNFLTPVCEKAPCTDLRSDPTLQQNSYRTTQADAYVNHAHQTSAARVVMNLIKLKHCRVKKTVSPSTPTC